MNYEYWSTRELVNLVLALEEALIVEFQNQGMTRGDAQGAVEAIVQKAS